MCVLLRKVPMELGFALGLFAVFGILRYRTEEIRMRDLTYMFIVIGIGIIAPLMLSRRYRHLPGRSLATTATLVLVGGFLLRLVIIFSSEMI